MMHLAIPPERQKDKQIALETVKRLFLEPGWVIVDTETTGIGEKDQIIEIAFLRCNSQFEPELRCSTYLKPTVPISDGAKALHNIDELALENAPQLPDAVGRLVKELSSVHSIWAVGAQFHSRLIRQTCRAFSTGAPTGAIRELYSLSTQIRCVMAVAAPIYGEWDSNRRGWAWPKFSPAYSAQHDCLKAFEWLKQLAAEEAAEW